MILVKVQSRPNDKVITIPVALHDAIGDAEYLKCTADENGLHYVPLKV